MGSLVGSLVGSPLASPRLVVVGTERRLSSPPGAVEGVHVLGVDGAELGLRWVLERSSDETSVGGLEAAPHLLVLPGAVQLLRTQKRVRSWAGLGQRMTQLWRLTRYAGSVAALGAACGWDLGRISAQKLGTRCNCCCEQQQQQQQRLAIFPSVLDHT